MGIFVFLTNTIAGPNIDFKDLDLIGLTTPVVE